MQIRLRAWQQPEWEKQMRMEKYVCPVCGWVYEEALGFPYEGIAPGTPWEAVPEGFICPMENCEVPKSFFAEYNA